MVTAGSAADADADAILALIILVVRFENKGKAWWYEVAQWTYDSCRAFLHFDTEPSVDGTERITRLGTCAYYVRKMLSAEVVNWSLIESIDW